MSEAIEKAFDPNKWAESWKDTVAEVERNSFQDSGWSASIAARCDSRFTALLQQLLHELREVELKPEDFFDRPVLAAVLSAVHQAHLEVTT